MLYLLTLLVGLITSTLGDDYPVATGYVVSTIFYLMVSIVDLVFSKRYQVKTMQPSPTPIKMVWFLGFSLGSSVEYYFPEVFAFIPDFLVGGVVYLGSLILSFLTLFGLVKVGDFLDAHYGRREKV